MASINTTIITENVFITSIKHLMDASHVHIVFSKQKVIKNIFGLQEESLVLISARVA